MQVIEKEGWAERSLGREGSKTLGCRGHSVHGYFVWIFGKVSSVRLHDGTS